MPFQAESSSYGEYSARKPFPFHVCTMDADGSGNKRPTEKSDKTSERKQHIDGLKPTAYLYAVYVFFLEGVFFRNTMKWADGKLRSLQKNQMVVFALGGVQ